MSGAMCPEQLLIDCKKLMNCNVFVGYGSTECSPLITQAKGRPYSENKFNSLRVSPYQSPSDWFRWTENKNCWGFDATYGRESGGSYWQNGGKRPNWRTACSRYKHLFRILGWQRKNKECYFNSCIACCTSLKIIGKRGSWWKGVVSYWGSCCNEGWWPHSISREE